jgi:hypothetical protein
MKYSTSSLVDCLTDPKYKDLRKGNPGAGKKANHAVKYLNTSGKEVLGLKYRTLEESTTDMVESLQERKFI